VHASLKALEEDNQPIRSAEELDQMEQEFISYTNQLATLLFKKNSKFA
jgi:hypothetical protein